jgi:hypothetical protein
VKRLTILAGALALLVCVYALIGFVGVPHFLRSEAQKFVATNYKRQLSLGEIHFNPFTLTLDMRDISFPDADKAPMLSASRLLVHLRYVSIWRRGPAFRLIRLEQPYVRTLIRGDGSLNLSDLAKPFASPPNAPPPKSSAPLRLFIDELAVLEGRTSFEDRTRPTTFHAELRPIDFDLHDFSTTGSGKDAYALDGESSQGERFHWDGRFSLNPVAARGNFSISNLKASTLWRYVRDTLKLEPPSGTVQLAGEYDFTTRGDPVGLKVDVHSLTVDDLGLRPTAADADYVHLAHVAVTETQFDLAGRSVAIGTVRLNGGEVRAWLKEDGSLNLLELAPPTASQTAAPADSGGAAEPAAAPPASRSPRTWSVSVPDIAVTGFKLSAEDRQVMPPATVTLDKLDVSVRGFRTPGDPALELAASAHVNGSGRLKASGSVTAGAGPSHVSLELADLDLTALQPYVASRTQLQLLSGVLGTKLAIDRSAQGAITVAGDTEVTKLRTVDNALKQDFVKWEQITVSGMQYRTQPASFEIKSIVARAPYARVIVASDRTLNIAEALTAHPGAAPPAGSSGDAAAQPKPAANRTKASAPQPSPKAASSSASVPISIGQVRVINGAAHYTDLWIQPHFSVSIQQLAGSVDGLSSNPRSRAKVELNGKVDRYAPVRVWGELNLLATTVYTDIKMSFHGLELTTVTPYSGHFAGYKIEKGKASVDLAYHIENRSLKADHHFVIDQLQLGDKVESPDAVKLPVKLAVALLKDRNGVIDLGVPVTGSLDDPKFRVGPIIWKVVVNLIEKAVTAPFALLGHLFGGGEQMNQIDFEPGSSELDSAAKERLGGVLKAMKERPGLQIDVPSPYARDLDSPALGQNLLTSKLLAQAGADPGVQKAATDKGNGTRADGSGPDGAKGDSSKVDGAKTDGADKTGKADDSVLNDPAQHFRLLLAVYKGQFGPGTTLPTATQAVVDAQRKKGSMPEFEPAIAELEAALTGKAQVTDADLERLARHRSRVIQDALLGSGEVDPGRVFVLAATDKPPQQNKVRAELALK